MDLSLLCILVSLSDSGFKRGILFHIYIRNVNPGYGSWGSSNFHELAGEQLGGLYRVNGLPD